MTDWSAVLWGFVAGTVAGFVAGSLAAGDLASGAWHGLLASALDGIVA